MLFFLFLNLVYLHEDKTTWLPEAIFKVSDLVEVDGAYWIVDHQNPSIFHVNENGVLLSAYQEKGTGPGAMIRPESVSVWDGNVYVLDFRQRKVLQFDRQLNFKESKLFQALVRSVHVNHHGIFIQGLGGQKKHLIHHYDHQWNKIRSFAPALEGGRWTAGFEAAKLLLFDNEIVLLHIFEPALRFYTISGEEKRVEWLPGYQESFWANLNTSNPRFQSKLNKRFTRLLWDSKYIYVGLYLVDEQKMPFFGFDRQAKTWHSFVYKGQTFVGENGALIRLVEQNETQRIGIQKLQEQRKADLTKVD